VIQQHNSKIRAIRRVTTAVVVIQFFIIDAGIGFFAGVKYIISVKDSESNMLGSAHESTTYGM
jgi:hypothetical protein